MWDGLKLGIEVCDDGNTVNNDGCQSDCLKIEYNCTCTGGSAITKDICTCMTPPIVKESNSKTH